MIQKNVVKISSSFIFHKWEAEENFINFCDEFYFLFNFSNFVCFEFFFQFKFFFWKTLMQVFIFLLKMSFHNSKHYKKLLKRNKLASRTLGKVLKRKGDDNNIEF